MGRSRVLLMIAVVGVLAGYGFVRWRSDPSTPTAAPSAEPAPAPPAAGTPPSNQLPPLPQARGSSFSVVGGMSREEMVRRGILPADAATAAPAVGRAAEGTGRAADGGEEQGPPSSLGFPMEIRTAAARYLCLCGCTHTLAACPCNDQPVGAVTMLTYLEKMMAADADAAAVDAAMVDRYGPRVLVRPPGD